MEKLKDDNINFTIKGSDLIGTSYEPIFPYFKDTKNAFKIIHGNFV